MTSPAAVTTARSPGPGEEDAARAAATRHALPFARRGDRALAAVAAEAGASALLVLARAQAALWVAAGQVGERGEAGGGRPERAGSSRGPANGGPLEAMSRWSPGMGALRLRRVMRGEGPRDPLLAAAGVREGDRVLDATLGLGMDAWVVAGAVGERGALVGLESSPALAAFAAEGLARRAEPLARRIEVVRAEAGAFLAAQPDRSFDLVLFDPMFRHARAQGPSFDLVRRLGDPQPLAAETLAEARRVARRCVVVKDGTPGWDLARLGLTPLDSARGAHKLYGRVPALHCGP